MDTGARIFPFHPIHKVMATSEDFVGVETRCRILPQNRGNGIRSYGRVSKYDG
jgi:hypothetical protein